MGAWGGSDGCPGGGRERDREMRDRAGGRGQEGREAGKDEGPSCKAPDSLVSRVEMDSEESADKMACSVLCAGI